MQKQMCQPFMSVCTDNNWHVKVLLTVKYVRVFLPPGPNDDAVVDAVETLKVSVFVI